MHGGVEIVGLIAYRAGLPAATCWTTLPGHALPQDATGPPSPAARPDTRAALELLDDLSPGDELERAALDHLTDVADRAWEARDRIGPTAYVRIWVTGLGDLVDDLRLDIGDAEARAAVRCAVRRLGACMDAVIATPESAESA